MGRPVIAGRGSHILRRVPVSLDSIRGIAALIAGLDVFPQGVTCCHYTRRVFESFECWAYVIDFIMLRVAGRDVVWWDRAT